MKSARGTFSLEWQGDILCLKLVGNCGLPLVQQLRQEAAQAWTARGPQPWGMFTDLTRFEGITPEALQAIWAILEEAIDHGMTAATDIRSPGHFRVTPTQTLQHIASRTHFQPSANLDEAMAWFSARGLRTA